MRRIEGLPWDHGHRIREGSSIVRLVVRNEVWPSVIARATRLIDLVVATRAASGGVYVRIGTDVAPVQEPAMRVDRDPIGIAMAHRIDLRSRLGCARRKEVSFGDGVSAIGLRMDADDLPTQVVRVRGRFLRVPWHSPWSLVDGGVAGSEGIRVVAGRHIEVALRVEGDGPAGVTALQALSRYLEENLFRLKVEGIFFHLEA